MVERQSMASLRGPRPEPTQRAGRSARPADVGHPRRGPRHRSDRRGRPLHSSRRSFDFARDVRDDVVECHRRVDARARDFAVPLASFAPKYHERFGRFVCEQRSVHVAESSEDDVVITVAPQGELLGQGSSRRRRKNDSSAGRNDPVSLVRESGPQRFEFARAKGTLALVAQVLRRRFAHRRRQDVVSVNGLATPELGERMRDGRLSGTGQTDENEAAHGQPGRAADEVEPRLAMYEAWLRVNSSTESPPNFRSASSAKTSAIIASLTTPSAGTAVTSVRSLNEIAVSCVTTSTVSSTGRFNVESGFMATLAMTGAPEEIPPSVPPA